MTWLQVLADPTGEIDVVQGFRGGSFLGGRYNPGCCGCEAVRGDGGHLAMTYTALGCLAILGDDFGTILAPHPRTTPSHNPGTTLVPYSAKV